MSRIRLKTKLVVAISGMVFALVAMFCYVYVSHLVRQRTLQAFTGAVFVAKEISEAAGKATQADTRTLAADRGNPQPREGDASDGSAAASVATRSTGQNQASVVEQARTVASRPVQAEAARASASNPPRQTEAANPKALSDPGAALRSDPGLTTLLDSIVGYSQTVYEPPLPIPAGGPWYTRRHSWSAINSRSVRTSSKSSMETSYANWKLCTALRASTTSRFRFVEKVGVLEISG